MQTKPQFYAKSLKSESLNEIQTIARHLPFDAQIAPSRNVYLYKTRLPCEFLSSHDIHYPWIVNSQQTLVVTVVVAAIAATAVTVTARVQCGWQKSATAAFTQHQF
uniref:Uncharacterized protein n=1 Tax=Glossina pallidipes TaxID=7398 RepID=A0A1B0A5A3_GLOPL